MSTLRPDDAASPPSRPQRDLSRSGRPYPDELVESVRILIETDGLTRHEAAAHSGLPKDTVTVWARRHGWVRGRGRIEREGSLSSVGARAHLPLEGGGRGATATREGVTQRPLPITPPRRSERAGSADPLLPGEGERRGLAPRRPGHAYDPAIVEAARLRVEGTRDAMGRIAQDLGVARFALYRWAKRHGWQRPASDKQAARYHRSRRFGFAWSGEARSVARDLVLDSNLPMLAIARRVGVDPGTLHAWKRRGGWARPPSVIARYPHYPRHPPAAVAEARELFLTTWLPASSIGRRVGCCGQTVWRWSRRYGWTRPARW